MGVARLPTQAALILLSLYKYLISPVLYALGVRCRHEPTCSAYSRDAIGAHGLWHGGWLTLGRLLRCRPGGSWGYDPAPETLHDTRWWKVWAFREHPVVCPACEASDNAQRSPSNTPGDGLETSMKAEGANLAPGRADVSEDQGKTARHD